MLSMETRIMFFQGFGLSDMVVWLIKARWICRFVTGHKKVYTGMLSVSTDKPNLRSSSSWRSLFCGVSLQVFPSLSSAFFPFSLTSYPVPR